MNLYFELTIGSLTQIIFLSGLFYSSLVFSQDTLQTIFQCDFENGICGLSTSPSWVLNQYEIPGSKTGPSQASGGNWYIYYEKLYNGNPTLTYTQTTPTPSNHVILSFYLHAYGANIISVDVTFNDANGNVIDDPYVIYGQLQSSSFDPFMPIVITKNLTSPFHTFEFTVSSSAGDLSAVAIDDIILSAIVLPNSSWTSWSSYSGCSVSCGSGTSSRSRICYLPTNNLPTQGCIGNNTEVQICNEGICPKSCNVNANITCSNINQPVILDDMSQTMQDINNTMSWWSWAATTSLFKSCNPADYNSTLLKLNDYISFVTATMDNIFMNVNRTIYFIACSNNSTIQQNLLSYCETAARQKDFLNVSLFQLQSYIKQVNSTILNCNSAVFEWTSWESWYPCSSSCNGGYTSRERYCNPVDTTNQQLHCYGTCTSCIGAFVDYKACNTQSCSNVLCDVLKNRDCSTVSKSALDLSKFLNVSSVNKVISEVSVWPFLITDELFKSCNLDTLVEQLTKLNSHMAMAYSARDNTLAHLEQVQDLIVCTTNNFVQPSLYDVCLNAAQQDIVLNAIVNQLNLYAQQYQTAIDACKSCGFACSIIESFIKVFFKSGM